MLICGTELTLYDIFPELICFVSFLPVIVMGTKRVDLVEAEDNHQPSLYWKTTLSASIYKNTQWRCYWIFYSAEYSIASNVLTASNQLLQENFYRRISYPYEFGLLHTFVRQWRSSSGARVPRLQKLKKTPLLFRYCCFLLITSTVNKLIVSENAVTTRTYICRY